jgi:hypothetical protein
VGASDCEGLIDASMESIPLKRARLGCDVDDASRQRAGPLHLCHFEVITDDPDGGTQHAMLASLRLEGLPCLSELLI